MTTATREDLLRLEGPIDGVLEALRVRGVGEGPVGAIAREAFEGGRAAGLEGRRASDCPFGHGDPRREAWIRGLCAGRAARSHGGPAAPDPASREDVGRLGEKIDRLALAVERLASRPVAASSRGTSALETAREKGARARRRGVAKDANPYPRGRGSAKYANAWDAGWGGAE